jgi:hypothetical protein
MGKRIGLVALAGFVMGLFAMPAQQKPLAAALTADDYAAINQLFATYC